MQRNRANPSTTTSSSCRVSGAKRSLNTDQMIPAASGSNLRAPTQREIDGRRFQLFGSAGLYLSAAVLWEAEHIATPRR